MIACRPAEMLNVAGPPPALYQSGDARDAALIAERTQTNPPLKATLQWKPRKAC